MDKQNFTDLINKAKANGQKKTIQKVVPVSLKETKETQFSFYIEKELLKKLKLKALENDTSIKSVINNAIKTFLTKNKNIN